MKACTRIALALVTVVTLAAVAASQPAERGVTATEIVLGTSMPTSGPAAFWGVPIAGAMDAWLKNINDQGGIHGRRLRLVARDDGYLPPRAVANTRELVERDNVFALVASLGTANVFAVRDYVIETQTLWITPLAGADIWAGFRRNKYVFSAYPSYIEEGIYLTTYAAQHLKSKTFAVFYQNDLYGQQGTLGIKRGIDRLPGTKLVRQVSYEVTDAEVAAQAQKLRESGADTVILYATPRHGALIVREMARLGYRPTLVSSFTLCDPAMFALAGEAWNDIYLSSYFPLPGTGDAKVEAVLQTLSRINPALARNPFNAIGGVAFIEPFLEGLRRTGPNLTKDRLVSAMESIRNWDGEILRGVTYGPDRRQGTNRLFMVKSERGQYRKLTDWYVYPTRF
ncbi:MAG: ABC transporter substrate-binding protein [Armatimonadota bacterium]|nr:ABC transporter substrate-binding protein [Armatimonadota bacterium]